MIEIPAQKTENFHISCTACFARDFFKFLLAARLDNQLVLSILVFLKVRFV